MEACSRKEVNIMPAIEIFEYEKVAYVKEMEEYLRKLKGLERSEAERLSYKNLVDSQIISENGDFTARYAYTRKTLQKRV